MILRRMNLATRASLVASALAISPIAFLTTSSMTASFASAQSPPAAAAVSWPRDSAGLNALGTQLVKAWHAKLAAQDADGAKAMLQDGFQSVNFRGALDRDGTLAAVKSAAKADATGPATVSGVVATRVGDARVGTCEVSAKESAGGVALPSAAAPRLSVWQWVDGAWRMAALGSMNMPSPRPAPVAPAFAGDASANAAGLAMVTAFLTAQTSKNYDRYEAMLAEGMQTVNFKGQKQRADLVKGVRYMTSTAPAAFAEVRATTCGPLTVVTCSMSLAVSVARSALPADPAPFMAVFEGTGDSAKVVATVNTNQPK